MSSVSFNSRSNLTKVIFTIFKVYFSKAYFHFIESRFYWFFIDSSYEELKFDKEKHNREQKRGLIFTF